MSGYDWLYTDMGESSRDAVCKFVQDTIDKNTEECRKKLTTAIGAAFTEAFSNLDCGMWAAFIRENSMPCDLYIQIAEDVRRKMLASKPGESDRWDRYMEELIGAWLEKYPEDASKFACDALMKENESLKRQLKYATGNY